MPSYFLDDYGVYNLNYENQVGRLGKIHIATFSNSGINNTVTVTGDEYERVDLVCDDNGLQSLFGEEFTVIYNWYFQELKIYGYQEK